MLMVPAPALPWTTSFITDAVFWNSPSLPKVGAPSKLMTFASTEGFNASGLLNLSTVSAVFRYAHSSCCLIAVSAPGARPVST
jgi:hypothetical protein